MFILMVKTAYVQDKFLKFFPNTGKEGYCMPGNEFCLPTSPTTFDFDSGAANTHTTDNWMVPFPVEVTKVNYLTNATQVFTNDNLEFGLCLPGSNITTVALAIGVHKFAGAAVSGDVVEGIYQSAKSGSNVLAANTLYEAATVVRPTGGIVAAVTKGIQVWVRPIPNTEN